MTSSVYPDMYKTLSPGRFEAGFRLVFRSRRQVVEHEARIKAQQIVGNIRVYGCKEAANICNLPLVDVAGNQKGAGHE